jgi:hypothetical protein
MRLADLRKLRLQRRARAGRAPPAQSPAAGAPAVPRSGAALIQYSSIRQRVGRPVGRPVWATQCGPPSVGRPVVSCPGGPPVSRRTPEGHWESWAVRHVSCRRQHRVAVDTVRNRGSTASPDGLTVFHRPVRGRGPGTGRAGDRAGSGGLRGPGGEPGARVRRPAVPHPRRAPAR